MHAYLDPKPFVDSASTRRLLDDLTKVLPSAATGSCMSVTDLSNAVAGVLNANNIPAASPQSPLVTYGLFYLAHDLMGKPTAFISPILVVRTGCKLRNHRPGETELLTFQRAAADGHQRSRAIMYTEVDVGEPLWELPDSAHPETLVAVLLKGNVFFLEHAMTTVAHTAWFFTLALHEIGLESPDRLYFALGCHSWLSGDLNWRDTGSILFAHWLQESFLRRHDVSKYKTGAPRIDEVFLRDYKAELKRRTIYHEIGGHYRDQLSLNMPMELPIETAPLGEARACLAQLAFSDDPLYGLVEMISFSIAASSQHATYAGTLIAKLLQKIGIASLPSPQRSLLEYARGMLGTKRERRLRTAAAELLDTEFPLRALKPQ